MEEIFYLYSIPIANIDPQLSLLIENSSFKSFYGLLQIWEFWQFAKRCQAVGYTPRVHIDPHHKAAHVTGCFLQQGPTSRISSKISLLAWIIMIFIEFFLFSTFHIPLNCFERFLLLWHACYNIQRAPSIYVYGHKLTLILYEYQSVKFEIQVLIIQVLKIRDPLTML